VLVVSIRRLVPIVALVACLPFVGGCASPAPPVEVMTFNVRYANPGDGDDTWGLRTELVFGVIRRHAPDIVGLQEALPEQMDELRAAFPAYRFLGQGREGERRGEYSALMVRDERLEVVESGDFWLSPNPDEVGSRGWDAALPRMCTWAVLRDRTGGDAFLAMNTHFDHRGGEARRESALVILERRTRHAGLALVLTGDLNAGEQSPPLDEFRTGGLHDTFRDAHPDAVEVGTFNGFKGTSDGAKIDYVLVDDGWSTLSAAIVRDHDGGRYPSDHFPVVATLVLR
jgi:endonuclease/exonuclease/phosphatase family metal-dependent hydrolase